MNCQACINYLREHSDTIVITVAILFFIAFFYVLIEISTHDEVTTCLYEEVKVMINEFPEISLEVEKMMEDEEISYKEYREILDLHKRAIVTSILEVNDD